MSREYFKDFSGRRIGWIDDFPDRQVGYNTAGQKKGWYDKRQNLTFNTAGQKVSVGNTLVSLITS